MSKDLLRRLPSVDELARDPALGGALSTHSRALVTEAARLAIDVVRDEIREGRRRSLSMDDLPVIALEKLRDVTAPALKKVVNATGTVIHTNAGRAVLSKTAMDAVMLAAGNNVNLELDLATGGRGERDCLVEGLVKRLTGAEAACVVNNNAAAVLLCLNTLAEDKEVIVSRGELIEIGGSFRLPDVIKKSGCVMVEVGTTNRTHPADYSSAVTDNTGVLFKAHTSNYEVVGFTAEVALSELAEMGRKGGIPVVEDLGSGTLVDLSRYGLPKEPLVAESIKAGADIVTFSGDKLLGGPQAGIIAGKKTLVDGIRKNPLKRALRAGKLTLAALEATLRLYLNEETLADTLPTLRALTRPLAEIEEAAQKAATLLRAGLGDGFTVTVEDGVSVVGGGTLPGRGIPTKAVAITHARKGPDAIARAFLANDPPILGRINKDRFLLDMRTVERPEDAVASLPPSWD
ncbi:MAG: L-seryl-tRNA(Sec) selenium transferase [Deltaproteobacteria bacterium]|nr:L-seryl-tRNA(Sec) selenium transferase [Deltaproteobacteria bacterium]